MQRKYTLIQEKRMNSSRDGITRDKGGPRKCWSCFQISWIQLSWRTKQICLQSRGTLYYSKAIPQWWCIQDRNHVHSKETNYIVSTNKIRSTKSLYLKLVNESVRRGKKETKQTLHLPETAELAQNNANTLWGVSTLHVLPNCFIAATVQRRAG